MATENITWSPFAYYVCSSLFKSPAAACILSSDWTIPKNLHPADCTSSINNHMPRRPSGEGVGGFSRQIRLNRLSLVVDREPLCVCVRSRSETISLVVYIYTSCEATIKCLPYAWHFPLPATPPRPVCIAKSSRELYRDNHGLHRKPSSGQRYLLYNIYTIPVAFFENFVHSEEKDVALDVYSRQSCLSLREDNPCCNCSHAALSGALIIVL